MGNISSFNLLVSILQIEQKDVVTIYVKDLRANIHELYMNRNDSEIILQEELEKRGLFNENCYLHFSSDVEDQKNVLMGQISSIIEIIEREKGGTKNKSIIKFGELFFYPSSFKINDLVNLLKNIFPKLQVVKKETKSTNLEGDYEFVTFQNLVNEKEKIVQIKGK